MPNSLLFEIVIKKAEQSREYSVTAFSSIGPGGTTQPLGLDLRPETRLRSVIAAIERDECDIDQLKDVGAQLWAGLLAGENEQLFNSARSKARSMGADAQVHIRLRVPPALTRLPWECIYDERTNRFLATDNQFSIIRDVDVEGITLNPSPTPDRKFRILVTIPENSDLATLREWNNMERLFKKFGDQAEAVRLGGKVTIDAVNAELRRGKYHAFHFIGHGEIDENRNFRIRLNGDNEAERWVEGDVFADLFNNTTIQLAFLNCCFGSQASPKRMTSGLGPDLIKRGVGAVVAMQYDIVDAQATKLSEVFYRELLEGQFAGHVPLSLGEARRAVWLNKTDETARGFVTPTLYLRPDSDPLFQFDAAPIPEVVNAHRDYEFDIPLALSKAVKQRRCIPVIGHMFLNNEPHRNKAMPPGPLQLARLLAGDCGYPANSDLDFPAALAGWLGTTTLQRVCQYYTNPQGNFQRVDLVERIGTIYYDHEIPKAFRDLTKWRAPGIVCTYFDGLLAEAFDRERMPSIVVSPSDQLAAIGSPEDVNRPGSDVPVLVQVCGLPKNPKSLVLTEQDHDTLLDQIAARQLPGSVTDLVTAQFGRSLLLLGVSPRDQLVRRLCGALVGPNKGTDRAIVYFVTPEIDVVDAISWRQFEMRWIRADPSEFVEALTSELAEAPTEGKNG